jgi:hypothetical protein
MYCVRVLSVLVLFLRFSRAAIIDSTIDPYFNYIGIPALNSSSTSKTNTYNASGNYTLPGFDPGDAPFSPFTGNWTWTTAVGPDRDENGTATTTQHLWLRTDPEINPSVPGFEYAGCAFVILGLPAKLSQTGKEDSGDCARMLSKNCSDELVRAFEAATTTIASSGNSNSQYYKCKYVAEIIDKRTGDSFSQCRDVFGQDGLKDVQIVPTCKMTQTDF